MDNFFKPFAVLLLFLAILIPVNSEAFFDNFNDSNYTTNNWVAGPGWSHVKKSGDDYAYQGIYNSKVDPNPGAGSFAENMKLWEWSDIEIDVLLRIDNAEGDDDGAGLIFVDDESYEHDCGIGLESNANRLGVWNQGNEIATTMLNVKTGYWYRLKVLIDSDGLMDVFLYDADDNSKLAEMTNLLLTFPFEDAHIGISAGKGASYDNFTLIYENGSTVRFQAGEIDNFEAPPDPAIPDPQIHALIGNHNLQWFDQIPGINGNPDTQIMHTFNNLPENIIGATLEISVMAGTEDVVDSGLATDGFDLITVDLKTPSNYMYYGRDFGPNQPEDYGVDTPIADPGFLQNTTWSPGDARVFTLDLSALPLIEGGSLNFIPDLNNNKNLTVVVDDETGVDYMLLTIETASIVPDIKANESDGPINIMSTESLSVTIELSPGGYAGDNADWWLVAATPFGLFHYQPVDGSWAPDLTYSHQGSLFNLGEFEALNISGLPTGSYTLYFGVDMNMNGLLDMEQAYYDSVTVNIQ